MKFENLTGSVIRKISMKEPEWFIQERLAAFKLFNKMKDENFKYGLTAKPMFLK